MFLPRNSAYRRRQAILGIAHAFGYACAVIGCVLVMAGALYGFVWGCWWFFTQLPWPPVN